MMTLADIQTIIDGLESQVAEITRVESDRGKDLLSALAAGVPPHKAMERAANVAAVRTAVQDALQRLEASLPEAAEREAEVDLNALRNQLAELDAKVKAEYAQRLIACLVDAIDLTEQITHDLKKHELTRVRFGVLDPLGAVDVDIDALWRQVEAARRKRPARLPRHDRNDLEMRIHTLRRDIDNKVNDLRARIDELRAKLAPRAVPVSIEMD